MKIIRVQTPRFCYVHGIAKAGRANAATTRIKPHVAHVLHKVAVVTPAAMVVATAAVTTHPHGSLKVSPIPCAPALT